MAEKALEAISSNNYLVELDPTDMNQVKPDDFFCVCVDFI